MDAFVANDADMARRRHPMMRWTVFFRAASRTGRYMEKERAISGRST
jgi:hypothetical protein